MIDYLRRLFRAHLFRRDEAAHPDGWSLARQLEASGYEPDPRYLTGRNRQAQKRDKSGFQRYADRERQVIPINRRAS